MLALKPLTSLGQDVDSFFLFFFSSLKGAFFFKETRVFVYKIGSWSLYLTIAINDNKIWMQL